MNRFVLEKCFDYAVLFQYGYLVDPASSICLSQRLSHASLSISIILRNCRKLIISVIVYLMVPYYMDTRSNSRANTCPETLTLWVGGDLLDTSQPGLVQFFGES